MSGETVIRQTVPVMGTMISLDLRPQGLPWLETRAAIERARASLHDADAVFSLYQPASPMSRIRRGELTISEAPACVAEVLALCERAREISEGWFDPWALPGGLDPTGLVKGWAAARALSLLRGAGLGAAMVNAAGDIATFGAPERGRAWQVGIRSPETSGALMCAVTVPPDGSVATSGTYERGSHIHDVRTGRPAEACVSATVCGPDLSMADALATALIAAGDAGLPAVEAAGSQALIVRADRSIAHTAAWAELALCEALPTR